MLRLPPSMLPSAAFADFISSLRLVVQLTRPVPLQFHCMGWGRRIAPRCQKTAVLVLDPDRTRLGGVESSAASL